MTADIRSSNGNSPCRLTRLMVVWTFLMIGGFSAIAAAETVKIGVYENAPKIFTDASGRPSGIFIDIIKHIAERQDWHLEYIHGGWGEGLDRLTRGEIDIMPDVAYTAQRELLFDFHQEPVLSDWFQIYARKNSGVKSVMDLDGKRIVVLERSVQQTAFEQMVDGFGLNMTISSLPDYKTVFQQVADGKADAAVTNRFHGVVHAGAAGLEDTAIIFNPTKLFFAAPSGQNKSLLSAIDAHLVQLKNNSDSVYYQTLKRWTSEEVPFTLPGWIAPVGLAVGIALLASLLGSFALKRQVDARTRDLRRINREMETRIEQRTAELAEAMEKAQEADRLKSAFLATMSHELRTPLNSIIGFTGILLQGLAGPLNEEQQKQMTMVQTSARHLLALINDVLDISKIEAGQLALSVASFELRPSIEKSVRLVSPLAEKKGIDLEMEIADNVTIATGDQRRLEQIILNLLNNAVKFTDKGLVRIECRADNDKYLLTVIDTGVGIKPEEMKGLFQPFHQIDTGLSRKRDGSGLGLSICKKLIVMMGGAIDVQSQWGQGSAFTVHFPVHAGESS